MKIKQARKYEMRARSQAAEKTSKNIMTALGQLWLERSIHEITLEMIAEKAGITVRTILRKYGSKEGLMEASMKSDPAGINAIKDEAQPGNIEQIVSTLMKEYEYTGMAGFRTLAVEKEFPMAARVLKKGREMHTKWCEKVFADFLPEKNTKKYNVMLGAFYAASDVYKWKLLRIDLGYSKEETEKIFIKTLRALTKTKK